MCIYFFLFNKYANILGGVILYFVNICVQYTLEKALSLSLSTYLLNIEIAQSLYFDYHIRKKIMNSITKLAHKLMLVSCCVLVLYGGFGVCTC